MNRKIGFDNRVCYEREVQRAQKLHQDRLRSMQSTSFSPAANRLDNSPPKRYPHLDANLKKCQLNADRYQQIYDENQHLMRKMNKIVATHPTESAVEFRPGMRLTIEQTPMLDSYLSPQSLSRGCAIEKGSMNKGFRQREHEKIEEENRKMLARLTNKKSAYSAARWDQEYKESLVRFKHVRQDATVGYLSPKKHQPSPYNVRDTNALPMLSPRDEGRGGVGTAPSPHRPSVAKPPTSPMETPKRISTGNFRPTYCTKKVPVLLLEATTSLGVHFTIEEIQIALVTPTETQLGDLGLLIRAKKDDREGEILVTTLRLRDVAHVLPGGIEDKLNAVESTPGVGNFPRVSQVLDEASLKPLLIKLVQSVRVTIDEDVLKLSLEISRTDTPLRAGDALDPQFERPKKEPRTLLHLFSSGEYPPRTLLKLKGATYLCHVHVYQLRRLLTFHALDAATDEAVNYQFTEAELLTAFKSPTPAVSVHDACRSLLKLALKRIQI
ncbi:hypothetical protein ACHHYP_03094 [Achlya hypogyna]|uniref:Uncharacterized protein n=1 Tax=Achlya hypogyna TaxID=1202772 RepID=A0A1V9Z4G2_ACHHY|nr:hypothetical protein ACHHYP_03094 [Achlya hypogyna]